MAAPQIKYATELPNTRKPGQTGIYRASDYPDTIIATPSPQITTLYETFQHALKISRDRPCIGHRPFDKTTRKHRDYVWQTYSQVAERATDFGSGLLHLNKTVLKRVTTEQWPVGIYSTNRPEWYITDQAVIAYNLTTVALYDTLGPDTVEYVVNHAEIPIVVAALNRIPGLIQLAPSMPGMKVIVSMDEIGDAETTDVGHPTAGKVLKAWAAEKGIVLLDFGEVEAIGRAHPLPHNPPSPKDIATICYTSGTTSLPKGALLTHANFIAASTAFLMRFDASQDEVFISYLPLAHILGRTIDITATTRGARIGFFRGDILTLIEDIELLKPTIFPSVPRLLTRIYAKLQQNTVEAAGVKGALARKAVAAKLQRLESGQGFTHPFWDRIIFNKIRKVLGGRVRLILTGSAPISPEVLQFLRIAFACDISEGYGQTEGVCAATVTRAGENQAGTVGGPLPCLEIKLVDVPEMNYLSTDKPFPRGELCFRGSNAFVGYYKDEEKTKETIDQEGWVQTGDIAYIDQRGAFYIVDRKKNIFKLSQGEYVAPEKIENIYLNSPYILQIFVHGDSLRNFLVAIVVPDPETFVPWANELTGKNVSLGDADGLQTLVADPKVRSAFLQEMDRIGKHAKLRGFEIVKAIQITQIPFSIENDLLTPTLKLKRHNARLYFRKEIDQLYQEEEHPTEKAKL